MVKDIPDDVGNLEVLVKLVSQLVFVLLVINLEKAVDVSVNQCYSLFKPRFSNFLIHFGFFKLDFFINMLVVV